MRKETLKTVGWSALFFAIIIIGLCAESIIDKLI